MKKSNYSVLRLLSILCTLFVLSLQTSAQQVTDQDAAYYQQKALMAASQRSTANNNVVPTLKATAPLNKKSTKAGAVFYDASGTPELAARSANYTGTCTLIPRPVNGTGWTALPRCDDCFQQVALPFTFTYYGVNYNQVFISNNGLLSFNQGVSAYIGTPFPAAGFPPLIAGFWGDVDTRNTTGLTSPGSNQVWYKIEAQRLIVFWDSVGVYPTNNALRNSFQVIISSPNNLGISSGAPGPQPNVAIIHGEMNWVLGTAGGSVANVGFDAGDGINFFNQALITPGGTGTSNINSLDSSCISYRVLSPNFPPKFNNLPTNNLVTVNCGQTTTLNFTVTPPETIQTSNVSVSNISTICGIATNITNNNTATVSGSITITGQACNVGTNTVTFTATDNDVDEPLTATYTLQINVVPPFPTITAVTPSFGIPGANVTITGTNFSTTGNTVTIGGINMPIVTQSATSITATLPSGICSGNIIVTNNCLGSSTGFPYTLSVIPTITFVSPTNGAPGTNVIISGTNFSATGNTVTIGGINMPIVTQSATIITATLPSGICNSNIIVRNNCGASSAEFSYTLSVIPTITFVSPTNGAPGTNVIISGTNFSATGNTITIGGINMPIVTQSATSITATLPTGICNGNIIVRNNCGSSSTGFAYTLSVVPTIVSVSPSNSTPGTNVTISGTNFSATGNAVTIGGVNMPIVNQSATSIIATLPSGLCNGNIIVTNNCGSSSTGFAYALSVIPTITNVAPSNASAGTTLVISGTNFSATGNSVTYNGVAMPVVLQSATSISATLPSGVCSGNIVVTNNCGSASNSFPYTASFAATITAGGPTTFCAGGSVSLDACAGTSYLWSNGATTQSITATTGGSYSVTVTNGNCVATSSAITVTVNPLPSATVTAGGPTTFCAGSSVSLNGPTVSNAGNGMDFNGSNASVRIPHNNAYNFTNQYSFESWINIRNYQYGTFISKFEDDGNNRSWMVNMGETGDATKVCVVHSRLGTWTNPIQWNTGFTPNLNTWYHIAVVFDATLPSNQLKLYVNGTLYSQTSWAYTITPNTMNMLLGGYDPPGNGVNAGAAARYLNGRMDEVRLWNIARTQAQISANYNASVPGNSSGLVAYYKFDEASGTSVTDASATNNNGTIINASRLIPSGATILGSGTLSYLWSPGGETTSSITATASGNYALTVTNQNGCSATSAATTVIVNPLPAATITAGGPTTFCAGGSVTLTASSGTSYLWNTGATTQSISVTNAGDYSVRVTGANGCTAFSAPTTVTVTPLPGATILTSAPTICNNNPITLDAATVGGNAMTFGGRYVDVPHSSSISLGSGTTYTIESWIRVTDNVNNTIVDKGDYNFLFQTHSNGNQGLGLYNQSFGWIYSAGVVPVNQWVHVAVTYDNRTVKFYQNGVLQGTYTASTNSTGDNGPLNIGRQQPSYCSCNIFDGSMDELRLWNVAKSQADIAASMNATVPTNSTGLVAYYKFDEGTGNTVSDATANANNGTMVGSPIWVVPSTSPVASVNQGASYSYLWSPTGATTSSIQTATPGAYSVTITNTTTGCSSTSPVLNLSSSVSPSITCGSDITVNNDNNSCGAIVNYPAAVLASGTQPVTITYSTPSGSLFPIGETVVTVTATNVCGTSTCSFKVTVVDNQMPTITCLPDTTIYISTGNCDGVVVNYNSTSTGNLYTTGAFDTYLRTYDPVTYTEINTQQITASDGNYYYNTNGLAKDPTTGDVYVILFDRSGSVPPNRVLAKLNLTTAYATVIGNTGRYFSSIAFTTNGTLYGVTGNGSGGGNQNSLYIINKTNATSTYLRSVTGNGNHALAFNKDDGMMYHWTSYTMEKIDLNSLTLTNIPMSTNGYDYYPGCATYIGNNEFLVGSYYGNYLTNFTTYGIGNVVAYPNYSKGLLLDNSSSSIAASDNCSYTVAQTAGLASGSFFPRGVTTNTFVVTDASGNTNTCSFNVSVLDTIKPTISCPQNIEITATSAAGAVVNYTAPVGTDNCTGATTTRTAGLASGSTFPLGYTTVTHKVTDASGNTAECSFIVHVSGLAPSITCPANISVNATNGQCGANVSFAATEVLGIPASTISYSHAPGSFFPVGTTEVTATATNAVGTSSCTFSVTVVDNQNPTITCPNNISTLATSAAGAVVTYTTPVGTDNCSGVTTALTAGLASGSTFPIGTTTVTYTASDAAGLSTSCSFTVTVVGVPPSITCPANISVNATNGQCGVIVNFSATETTAIPASTITYSHAPGSFFPVGTTEVTAIASNAVGFSSCTFNVTVVDDQFPVLVGVPANTTVECDAVPAAAVVTATDNCTTSAVSYTETRTNGNCPGRYTLTRTWSTTDASNNTTTETQIIIVQDTQAPVLSAAPADETVSCNAIPAAATLTAMDNCDAEPVVTYTQSSSQNADVNNIGHYNYTLTRTWIATDACGNTSSKTQIITVVDATAPVITCPENVTLNCQDNNTSSATGVATATDNCSPVTITQSQTSTQNADVNNAAHYNYVITRTWRATDVTGNFSECVQTITVEDVTKPIITCPADVTVNCQDNNTSSATGVATATDNCSPVTITQSQTSTQNADVNNAAHYNYVITRTWRATDVTGNFSECVQTITVEDVTKPIITCPADVTVNCQDNNSSSATGVATATDNCSPVTITQSQTSTQNADVNNAAHYNYVITRTWRATDVTGNFSECVQTITVQDITNPVITTCPTVAESCNDLAGNSRTATLIASDNCSPVTISYTLSGATTKATPTVSATAAENFNIGTTTIHWTVKDVTGNTSNCVTTVIIRPLPVVSFTTTDANAFCNKLTLTAASTLSGPYSFAWSYNNTPFANTQTIELDNANGDGNYSVYSFDGFGCRSAVPAVYNYQKQNIISNYTILAYKEVEMKEYSQVQSGSVGLMRSSGEAEFKKYSSMTGGTGTFVKAPKIKVEQGANVPNRIIGITTVSLPTMQKNLITNQQINALPSYTVNQFVTVTLNGNYKSLKIRKGANVSLNGTIFGNIDIEEGAIVRFTQATLNISDLKVGKGPSNGSTTVKFAENTSVRVSKQVKVEEDCYINPDGYKVTFYLGDEKCDEEKFQVKGGNTTVIANIYAPSGKIKVTGGSNCHSHHSCGGNNGNGHGNHDDDDDDDNRHGNGHSNNNNNNCNAVKMTGLFIADEVKSQGKYVIWNGYDCSAVTPVSNYVSAPVQEVINTPENNLEVKVAPNPSLTDFVLLVNSKNEEPITIRVSDSYGKVVTLLNKVIPGSAMRVGSNYTSGIYFAEVIQGKQRKVVKLIKGI